MMFEVALCKEHEGHEGDTKIANPDSTVDRRIRTRFQIIFTIRKEKRQSIYTNLWCMLCLLKRLNYC